MPARRHRVTPHAGVGQHAGGQIRATIPGAPSTSAITMAMVWAPRRTEQAPLHPAQCSALQFGRGLAAHEIEMLGLAEEVGLVGGQQIHGNLALPGVGLHAPEVAP